MPRKFFLSANALLVFVALSILSFSHPVFSASTPFKEPRNLEQTDFYLLTIGKGEDLYTRFGHSILAMVDREAERETCFNWGMFDFRDPLSFGLRFFRGILTYNMGWSSCMAAIRTYQDFEERSVIKEKIILTKTQKQRLVERLVWNSKPENIHYSYLFFFDNCSTRIRDYLDEALGGRIRQETSEASAGNVTYRDHVRRHLDTLPAVVMGLDIFLNSTVDRTMSRWEEMFLPAKMRDYLLSIPAFDDSGLPIEGSRLLQDTQTLVTFPEIPSYDLNFAYYSAIAVIGTPLLVFAGLFIFPPRRKLSIRFLGFSYALLGALGGFMGIVMTLAAFFSEHTVLKHDANLFAFWPIDWLAVWIGSSLLLRGKPFSRNSIKRGISLVFCIGHLLGVSLLLVAWLTRLTSQDVSRSLIFFGTLTVLLNLSLFVVSNYNDQKADN